MGGGSFAADGARLIPRRLRPDTLRGHLLLLVLAAVVPVTIFALVTVGYVLQAKRAAEERGVLDAARLVAQAVDRELTSAETALRVLSTSIALRAGDLATFREQALTARTSQDAWIVLFDRAAMQLVNTRFPVGTPLARRTNPEIVDQAFATREASVSDLYEGALARRLIVTVDVPVVRDGEVHGVLTQAFFPEYFQRVLLEYALPPGWIVGIFDRTGRTIARSTRAEEFVGRPARPEIIEAARAAREGALRHRVLVVDNDPDNLELIQIQLVFAGADVVAVTSAQQALDEFTRTPPDVVVTDVGMPGEDGYWLLAQLRGRAKAIAVTAFGGRDERQRLLEAGFAAHVPKPTDGAGLVAVVRAVVEP